MIRVGLTQYELETLIELVRQADVLGVFYKDPFRQETLPDLMRTLTGAHRAMMESHNAKGQGR